MTFGDIRNAALTHWLENSKHSLNDIGHDEYANAFECDWQLRAEEEDFSHISLFCSIGDFAGNITDLLTDTRFDNLTAANEEERAILFRYYTRVLLVSSEVFTDFQDLWKEMNDATQGSARTALSTSLSIKKVQGFINQICKHKHRNWHLCNHHNWMLFEDFDELSESDNALSIGNCSITDANARSIDSVVMPSLIKVLTGICDAYQTVDTKFKDDAAIFQIICNKYQE